MSTEEKPLRLQLFLSRSGIGSRRKCEEYIAAGRVAVNGHTVQQQGVKVTSGDTVEFDGMRVKPQQTHRYYVLNKPPGFICANSDPQGRRLALELLPKEQGIRLFHVGRLDMFSEGLIFFTNDGDFANAVMHPSNEVDKSYLVRTAQPVPEEDLKIFCRGVVVDGIRYVVETYKRKGDREVLLTLKEGKNREIRNLFSHMQIQIKQLIRVRIGPVRIGSLSSGEYRTLTAAEREQLVSGQPGKSVRRKQQ